MITTQHALSDEFMHESACSLAEEGHKINHDFINVMHETVETAPIDAQFYATGCPSCHTNNPPSTGVLYYVAQGDATETVSVKYDIIEPQSEQQTESTTADRNTTVQITDSDETFSVTEFGALLVETAEKRDIDVSWTGDVSDSVILGSKKAYLTYEDGETVERDVPHDDREGTAIKADKEDLCPRGYTKVDWGDGNASIISTGNLSLLSSPSE